MIVIHISREYSYWFGRQLHTVHAPDMPEHLISQWQHQEQGRFSRVLKETEAYSQQELS